MPNITLLDIPQAEHAQMLAALRRARYGYLLARHVLLLCAAGRTPMEIAAYLFCSRSSVYRTVRAYRTGTRGCTCDEEDHLRPPSAHHRNALRPEAGAAGVAQSRATRLWLVPHALELCHAGPDAAGQTEHLGLGRDDAALAS
jgi:Winged helix-turn helix